MVAIGLLPKSYFSDSLFLHNSRKAFYLAHRLRFFLILLTEIPILMSLTSYG